MLSPTYLEPDYRYARDDWQGANALKYYVYSVEPVLADDGVTILSPGIPLVLTGYTVTGEIYYRPRRYGDLAERSDNGAPISGVVGAVLDATNGIITLSVPKAATIIARQRMDCWANPDDSKLIARPQIVDSAGNVVTVGLQPLFVF